MLYEVITFDVDRILLMMPDAEGKTLRCRASVGNVFESSYNFV